MAWFLCNVAENVSQKCPNTMKKILLTLAGSALLSLAVVQAQQQSDSTNSRTQQSTTTRQKSRTQQGSDQYKTDQGMSKDKTQGTQHNGNYSHKSSSRSQWRDEDRQTVSREKLPSSLLQTLNSDRYKGWENATIYKNKQTDEYMLIISDNGEPRTFYFDKNGKASSYNEPYGSGDRSGSGVSSGSDNQSNDQSSSSGMSGQTSGSTSDRTQSSGVSGQTSGSSTSGSSTSGSTDYNSQGSQSTGQSGQTSGSSTSGSTDYRSQSSGVSGTSGNDNSSTSGSSTSGSSTLGSSTSGSQTQTQQPSKQWRADERVVVSSSELPVSLRTTLQGDQYKGWENSTVYRNKSTNEYMVEIRDGSSSKTYYFDKDGKAIDNMNNNNK
jgi:hypothetical protein